MSGCKVMADTPISKLTLNSLAGLGISIQSPVQTPAAVAFSGGADSTALLLMLARQHPGQVQAIHIHHGLQTAADDFSSHCQAICNRLGVLLHVVSVNARAASGQSPEDAARRARYTALSFKISELNQALAGRNKAQTAIKTVAIAQHADDQIETLLLALSRGAGLPGLSAMPARWRRDGIEFVRPLLGATSLEIRAWLAGEGLAARRVGVHSCHEAAPAARVLPQREAVRRRDGAVQAVPLHVRDFAVRNAADQLGNGSRLIAARTVIHDQIEAHTSG